MSDPTRTQITGKVVSLDGSDIDTDRIIPARFLRCVTFDDLGAHAFDDPTRQKARVLLVDRNFGCGSSREHAPQALMRWGAGISAIIGESYAEIFFGNCVALGIPCLTASAEDIAKLKRAVAANSTLEVSVDVEQGTASAGDVRIAVSMPAGAKKQLTTGRWDSSAELLEGREQVADTARALPYFAHWQ